MTPNELMNLYYLARIIGWRHELELLDAEAVAELIKALKIANNQLRERIAAELPEVWASYTPDKGGAAIRLWLGELMTDPAMQINNTITEAWSISAQQSLNAYNDILSVGGQAKNVATVPITIETIKGLASKKLFAGYSLGELVGKAFSEGQIAAIITSLDDSIKQGVGYPKAIKALKDKAIDEGLVITQRQVITLARSYIQQASVNAQLAVYERNKEVLKGVQWVGILDNRICPLCFPGATEVTPIGKLRGVSKRPYFGDIVTITTASGKQVSATPKHPVLTPEGWCALEKLNPGDQVIYSEKGDVLHVLREQEINMPTKFSELFDLFCSNAFTEIQRNRTSADAFNGDSGILHDQIATIGINRLLKGDISNSALAQFIPYKRFTLDDSDLSLFPSDSPLDIIFNRMRARAFGLASQFNAKLIQCSPNKIRIKSLGHNLFWRETSFIKFYNLFLFFLFASTSISHRNVWHSLVFDKKIGDSGGGNGKMFCDLTGGNALPVHCEDVVSVRRKFRSCHVYNLHCNEELYIANGFIVKNCATLDGTQYEWGEERPPMPRHPRCMLPNTRVYAPDAIAAFKAEYDGPAYYIVLENGSYFYTTAHHPILTDKGFVPAHQVDQDSKIFCNEKHIGLGKPISDIYNEMLAQSGASEKIDISQASLHGDGFYSTDCVELTQNKLCPEVSKFDERLQLYEHLHCGARNRSIYELLVSPKNLLEWWGNGKSWLSLQNVKVKEKIHYRGPVYDLQTLTTLYYADIAIVSNCRCLWLPWVKSWRDLGIDADDLEKAARPWLIREPGAINEGGNRKVLNYGKTTEYFGGWWETLDFKTQAQIIGPVRTRLIRNGELRWEDLVNKNSGRYYTLAELGFSESGKKL